MLLTQDHRFYIFDELSETMGSRSRKQCSMFLKTMISEIKKRTKQTLVEWSVLKLQKTTDVPRIKELLNELEAKRNEKSDYMQLLEEWKSDDESSE